MMMRPLAAAALLALAITGSARGAEPPMGDCDRLAAHPQDPQRVHAGTAIAALDGERAVEACEAALAAAPETARFRFQYARALEKLDLFQSALGQYRIAAKEGYPAAQYAMGLIFERSKVMPFNNMKAARWYRGAADAGHPAAQFRLGLLYRTGGGVRQDDGEALTLLRAAAGQGLARAQYVVGQMYDLGLGVVEDDDQAAAWYQRAAGQGFARAKLALAALTVAVQDLAGGEVSEAEAPAEVAVATVPLGAETPAVAVVEVEAAKPEAAVEVTEPEAAVEVTEPEAAVATVEPEAVVEATEPEAAVAAAEPDAAAANSEAQALPDVRFVANALGAGLSAYQAGDYETAYLTWFPLAEVGIGRAEYYIGGLLMEGRGVETDNVRAYFWLKRAATKGYAPARPLLIELTSRMSAEEMKGAEELIASGGPTS
jgi:TPR repeat protein